MAEAELLKALRTLQMPGATPDGLARARIRVARAHIETATGGLDGLAEAPAPELVRERDDFGFPRPGGRRLPALAQRTPFARAEPRGRPVSPAAHARPVRPADAGASRSAACRRHPRWPV